jgi:hypothetical protein
MRAPTTRRALPALLLALLALFAGGCGGAAAWDLEDGSTLVRTAEGEFVVVRKTPLEKAAGVARQVDAITGTVISAGAASNVRFDRR